MFELNFLYLIELIININVDYCCQWIVHDKEYLGLSKSSCIDRKKYEDKEKALILFH